MSIYGEWLAATIESDGTSSGQVDLGKVYDFLDIQIPTMTACTIKLTVAEKLGGTYRDLGDGVTTDSGTFDRADAFKLGGYQYIKVVASKTQAAQRLIRVRGGRY